MPLNDTIINNLDTGSQIIDIHSSIRVGKYDKTFSSLIDFEIFKDSITRLTINFPEDCKSNRNALSITCPKCKRTDKILPIVYGLTVPLFDETGKLIKSEPFYSGGCMVTKCDASWYCNRDRLKF